jgi:cell division protein FtsI (penicillin-binding protein 3)
MPKKRQPKRNTHPDRGHRFRIYFSGLLLTLFIGAIVLRLVQLQLDPDLRFSEQDLKRIGSIQIERPRGDILDRSGRTLATNRIVYSLSVDPEKIKHPKETAAYLSPRLGMSQRDLIERLTRTNAQGRPMRMVWLKRRMLSDEAAQLGDWKSLKDAKGLTLHNELKRYYPENDLASQVLGFANHEGIGSEGIELKYDQYLTGVAGEQKTRAIPNGDKGRLLLGFKTLSYKAPTGGDNVRLTLDSTIQYSLEQSLDKAMAENNAKQAMGIVMDVDTGAILALSNRPGYNPNFFNDVEAGIRRNRVVTDIFEPGSSFKIVTASAALELGLIAPDDQIDCMGGKFNPYGHTIRDTHELDVAPFWETFAQSSNIAIIKVAALLGEERLESWIRRFGFGQRTKLDVPGEISGFFRPRAKWNGLSMGSLPMGQEIGVTAIQLAKAFSVIGNGGNLVQPYMVDKIRSKEGELLYSYQAEPKQRIISEDIATTMQELCHLVVTSEDGTGEKAAIPEYRVGGKTGTAQIADHVNGGYYKDKYTTIFAGFGPINNPRLACVIVVQEPMVRLHYGGHVCGPVFREVMRDALIHLNVPPDPMAGEDAEKARGLRLAENEADADTVSDRVVLDLLEPTELDINVDRLDLVQAKTDSVDLGEVMPSFIGLSKLAAKQQAIKLGIQWDPRGVGRVVRQEPAVGTSMKDVRVCKLIFSTTHDQDA